MTVAWTGERGEGDAVVAPTASRPGLDELYRLHYRETARLAGLLLGDFPAGEEMAQEAFARLSERWESLDAPEAYLRTTVTNLCRSRIRRAVVARRHPSPPPPDVAGPEEDIGRIAAEVPLRQALRQLPHRQREAVVLRFYEGLHEAEMAEVMGISPGAVKSHLHRALATLSRELEALR